MAARFLYTYIYIYRVCIFKAFVTNTFGIDSDVLHFKPQNRNDLKMKKNPKKPNKTKKVFSFATKTLLLSSIITWTILTTHHGYLICCLKWAHRSLRKIREFSWNNKSRRSKGSFKLKGITGRYYQGHKLASTGHLHLNEAQLDLQNLQNADLEFQVRKCVPTEIISRPHHMVWMSSALGSNPCHVAQNAILQTKEAFIQCPAFSDLQFLYWFFVRLTLDTFLAWIYTLSSDSLLMALSESIS